MLYLFYKARMVPYAMCEKLEEELDRLVVEGILKPMANFASGEKW